MWAPPVSGRRLEPERSAVEREGKRALGSGALVGL
jgi:hypothetical protein